MRAPTIALSLTVAAATSFAAPYDNRGFVDGANHHVGDAGFRAREGREPAAGDEKLRMHDHLVYVRDLLGSQPATRPELAAKRAELLRYLDDYIAAGTTPHNEALPWRTPVFIDDAGRICAVGYLIERSVGRDLAERIASAHRYEYLEDIAAAMPEVDMWIAASGLTLDELASIQPGYMQPAVEDWVRWDLQKLPPAEGPYTDSQTTGAWRGREMDGTWTRTIAGHVVGKGDLHRGRGRWTSFYPDGAKLAEGEIVHSDPDGAWKMYHPSGRIAAEGELSRGVRVGAWHFYYDAPGEIPIAIGEFSANGMIKGDWKHYDNHGHLVAISSSAPPVYDYGFGGYLLSIVPAKDGIQHDIHIIGGPDRHRLELLIGDGEKLYVNYSLENATYDADGNRLDKVDGAWMATSCGWNAKRKRIAQAGDVTTLHGLLFNDNHRPETACNGTPKPVAAERAARIDRLIGTLDEIRVHTPEFIDALTKNPKLNGIDDDNDADVVGHRDSQDLMRVLAINMIWYVEWPHVDLRFVQLFHTVPGYWAGRPNGNPRDEAERTPKAEGDDY